MSDVDSLNDWSSDDDVSNPETPIANGANLPRQSQRRPAKSLLPFVAWDDWVPGESYDDQPPFCIHYRLEWKLTLNKRTVAKQTEKDLVVAPSDFWTEKLSSKITAIAQSTGKTCEPSATIMALSVNERNEDPVNNYYPQLDIDWPDVERQLQAWGHLLRIGKKLKIEIAFNYIESGKAATGHGATATQLADNNTRLAAEQAVSGRPDVWRDVFRIFRCEGQLCDGEYCWQDSTAGNKHYKFLHHQLRDLVRLKQRGGKLDSHDDVPEEIRKQLRAVEHGRPARRKKNDAGAFPPSHTPVVINNYIPAQPGQASQALIEASLPVGSGNEQFRLSIPGLRDDAVTAYCEWHCSKVRSQRQKKQYESARDLTLEFGLDLELVEEDKDAQFYIDHGIMEGVARRWVRDVKAFLKEHYTAL